MLNSGLRLVTGCAHDYDGSRQLPCCQMMQDHGLCAIYSQTLCGCGCVLDSSSTYCQLLLVCLNYFTMLEYVKESLSHLLCDLVLMIPIKSIIINILY